MDWMGGDVCGWLCECRCSMPLVVAFVLLHCGGVMCMLDSPLS
jgi:hypothetical protein